MRQRSFRMNMGTWPTRGAFVLGLLLLSCSKKPASAPNAEASAGDQKAGAAATEAEDTTPLEPAPAPSGVFLRARIKSPGGLLTAIGDAASSPFDWRSLLATADAESRRVVEKVIDLDGPVEALVALHPVSGQEPMAVVSVSARGVRAALQGLDAEGIDTRQGPEGIHYFQLSDDECALGRSLGRSPARIVCADRAESLDSLLPYALRGFPAEALGDSEVALRVVAEPLQKQYGKQLRGLRLLGSVAARQLHRDSPRVDAAISDAVLGLVDEVISVGEDVQKLDFDLWDRQGAFESDLVLTLTGKSSWLVNTSRQWAGAQGPAPELARQLPAEATFVGYFRQPPKKTTDRLAHVIGELGAGTLEAEGVSRATADRLARSLALVFAADRTVAYATGPLREGAKRVAWSLIGVDQERKDVLEIIDGFAAVIADKQFAKIDIEQGHRPEFRRKNMKLTSGPSAVVYEWRLPETVVSALERGTQELVEEGVHAADAGGVEQFERGYLAVMSVGGVTWVSVSTDQTGLVDSFAKVQGDLPRLASSREFAGFVEEPALAANAVRLAGFVDQLAPVLTSEALQTSRSALASAPHRGAFPMTSFVSVTAGETTELRWRGRVPDEFVTDAAALVLAFSVGDEAPEKPR